MFISFPPFSSLQIITKFISFPHLFDHVIEGFISFADLFIWAVYPKKNHVLPTYLFILTFNFIIYSKSIQWIASIVQNFPNLLVHVIIGLHWFAPPTSWVYHETLWVLVACSFIMSLDFISSPHLILHCIIRFHQFSPTCLLMLSLVFVNVARPICWFYHCPSLVFPIHSLISSLYSIGVPNLFVKFHTRFHQFSPPIGSFYHWISLGVPIYFIFLSVEFIQFPPPLQCVCLLHAIQTHSFWTQFVLFMYLGRNTAQIIPKVPATCDTWWLHKDIERFTDTRNEGQKTCKHIHDYCSNSSTMIEPISQTCCSHVKTLKRPTNQRSQA